MPGREVGGEVGREVSPGYICIGILTLSIFKYIYFVMPFKGLYVMLKLMFSFIVLWKDVPEVSQVLRFYHRNKTSQAKTIQSNSGNTLKNMSTQNIPIGIAKL